MSARRWRLLTGCALAAAVVLSNGTTARAQEAPLTADESKALEHYRRGSGLLKDGNPRAAIPELEASRALYPSLNTDLVLAHAHRELGERVEALALYEGVVTMSGKLEFEDAVAEARRWIGVLMLQVGTVRIVAPPGAVVTVRDGSGKERTGSSPTQLVEPGRVTAKTIVDGKSYVQTVDIAGGETRELTLTAIAQLVEEPPTGLGGLAIGAIVTGGLAGVGIGMFIGFGLSVRDAQTTLDACEGPCPAELEQVRERGKRDQIIANVSISAGSVLAAASVVMAIASVVTRTPRQQALLRPSFGVSQEGGFFGFEGSF